MSSFYGPRGSCNSRRGSAWVGLCRRGTFSACSPLIWGMCSGRGSKPSRIQTDTYSVVVPTHRPGRTNNHALCLNAIAIEGRTPCGATLRSQARTTAQKDA